ncbi:MAG: hypothetical protein ACJAYB_001235 [Psychromonas sp.]|jgi:hypothetical protein
MLLGNMGDDCATGVAFTRGSLREKTIFMVSFLVNVQGQQVCGVLNLFFDVKRIQAVREMIVSADLEGRERALSKIMPMQKSDFIGLF